LGWLRPTPLTERENAARLAGDGAVDGASARRGEIRYLMRIRLLHQHLGKGGLDERIAELLESGRFSSMRVLVAFAKGPGIGLISPALEEFIRAGGNVEVIVGLDLDGTTPDALESLVGLGATVFVFGVRGDRTFHPKVMIFDTDPPDEFAVVVGSNNWTPGGLDSNFEVALEVSAKRSESTEARNLSKQVEELWGTYRVPRSPLERDKHLKQVTTQRLSRWSMDMPRGAATSAPDQRESTLAERIFSAVREALPRKPMRRPPREKRAAGVTARAAGSTAGTAPSGALPDTLYLVVTGEETSRGGEIQVPTDALREYFGVGANDSLWVTFRHADGDIENNRKVGVYTRNKTYRLSSSKFSRAPRPFILQLDRVAPDDFAVTFHFSGTRGYAAADNLATRGGGASKRWGTA
jgi:HKD family nuclease